MADIICYDADGKILTHLTQWDTNQKVIIKGVDDVSSPEFHFCNSLSDEALIIDANINDGGLEAIIPDILLQKALPLYIYIYSTRDSGFNTTKHTVRIPVMPRARPVNYSYRDPDYGSTTNSVNIIVDDERPAINTVLWFDTSVKADN